MKVVYTIDHRFGDAALGMKFMRIYKDYIEDPENFNLDSYQDAIPYELINRNESGKKSV